LTDDKAVLAARQLLRDAVRAIDRSRGALRSTDSREAVDGWKGLVAARWSLVVQFESDGTRYILARRNNGSTESATLSSREQQAVAYAALGHHNKLIADEMGLASGTVGVLLHRAAKKLGAGDRKALINAFAKTLRGAQRQPDVAVPNLGDDP
jgi:DNA-binding NarL/FixJ family response regulator